jgi:hypothetical protein
MGYMEQKCSYLTAAYMNFFVDRVVIAPNALEHNDEKLLTYNCTSQSNGIIIFGPKVYVPTKLLRFH